MKKLASFLFRDLEQERIFKFILKAAQNVSPETYAKYEGRAKSVLELPSIRTEYEKSQTFNTPFKSSPEQFLVKVEFWLRTVFPKLEAEKIKRLMVIAKAESAKAATNNSDTKEPFDFLLVCMSTEPDPITYALNKVEAKKTEKLKSVSWDDL